MNDRSFDLTLAFASLGLLLEIVAPFAPGLGRLFSRLLAGLTMLAEPSDESPGGVKIRPFAPTVDELHKGVGTLPISTWSVSSERDAYILRRPRSSVAAFGGASWVIAGISGLQVYPSHGTATNGGLAHVLSIVLIALGAIVVLYAAMPYVAGRYAFRQRMLATASARVDKAISRACKPKRGNKPLRLEQLYELNRRQLDQYQLMTQRQQKSAYWLAQVASLISLGVLIAGIAIVLTKQGTLNKSLGGGLSALGSTLSAFLAATFISQRKAANREMSRYYLEPQRTGRLLAAERIVTKLTPSATLLHAPVGSAGGTGNGNQPPHGPNPQGGDGATPSKAAKAAKAVVDPAAPPAPDHPASPVPDPGNGSGSSDSANGTPAYVTVIEQMVQQVLSWEMPERQAATGNAGSKDKKQKTDTAASGTQQQGVAAPSTGAG
jgi:hypothetical protein